MALLTLTGICAPGVFDVGELQFNAVAKGGGLRLRLAGISGLVKNVSQSGRDRFDRGIGWNRVVGGVAIDGHIKLVACGGRKVGQGLPPKASTNKSPAEMGRFDAAAVD